MRRDLHELQGLWKALRGLQPATAEMWQQVARDLERHIYQAKHWATALRQQSSETYIVPDRLREVAKRLAAQERYDPSTMTREEARIAGESATRSRWAALFSPAELAIKRAADLHNQIGSLEARGGMTLSDWVAEYGYEVVPESLLGGQ